MFTFDSSDGLTVHVHEWQPDGPPRGVVQLAHGMGEHARRYAPLARALNERGYAVYANDHRGHGATIHAEPGRLGADGWNLLVADMAALSRILRERHPGLPLVLVGHSLGSFAAQQYLLEHADLLTGAALSGTTAVDLFLGSVPPGTSDLNEVFNAPFQPVRTTADWLSRDAEQVDLYVADPLCGFTLDEEALVGLATAAFGPLTDLSGVRTDLPLYVLVGDHDPLNRRLEFSDALVERYRKAGVADIVYRTYPGARHEVLNETNRAQVIGELVEWVDRVSGG